MRRELVQAAHDRGDVRELVRNRVLARHVGAAQHARCPERDRVPLVLRLLPLDGGKGGVIAGNDDGLSQVPFLGVMPPLWAAPIP